MYDVIRHHYIERAIKWCAIKLTLCSLKKCVIDDIQAPARAQRAPSELVPKIVESKGGEEKCRELGGKAEFSPMVAPELTGGTWLGYGVNEYDSPLLLCLL